MLIDLIAVFSIIIHYELPLVPVDYAYLIPPPCTAACPCCAM